MRPMCPDRPQARTIGGTIWTRTDTSRPEPVGWRPKGRCSVGNVVTIQPCSKNEDALHPTDRKKQKIVGPPRGPATKQRKLLSVKVTCENEPCDVKVKGKARTPGEKVKLKTQQVFLQAGETKKLRLEATSRRAVRTARSSWSRRR